MSRLKRHLLKDCCCHITHRCHNREFLFRFKHEREEYRNLLIEMTKKYNLSILNYIITSNHIHLLLSTDDISKISSGMRFVQGTMAQRYNRLKKREGSFWRDRYNITLIENGQHLCRCIFYIDFNMIRAGVISHPKDWRWSGYDELSGKRKRYRLIDFDSLLRSVGIKDNVTFTAWYNNTIKEELNKYHTKQDFWSTSLAVGSKEWLENIAVSIPRNNRKLSHINIDTNSKNIIKEDISVYSLKTSRREAAHFTRHIK